MCSVNEPARHCEDITTSQLYAAFLEDFEAQITWSGGDNIGANCHFTSRIKSKIRILLAQMHGTYTACRISGCPEMDQGKTKLYSFGDEKNEKKENLAKNYCHVACVSDALK